MKLGAQLYTLRNHCKTPADIRQTFRRVKALGYEVVQVSGCGPIDANELNEISLESDLPITCTHSPLDRIVNDTDKLIAEHKIYRCPVIGIGSMPNEYRASVEACRAFIELTREPLKKIRAAGMTLTYHNHAFEFADLGGTDLYEVLIEESELDFIHDTYWSTFAGRNPIDYIKRLKGRMTNIHFKDMSAEEGHPICACGNGVIDFVPIIAACREAGISYAHVEQDNADKFGDEFEQMQISFRHLKPLMA